MAPVVEDPHLLTPDAIADWEADAHASLDTLECVVDLPDHAKGQPL
jgi:hypothetical protein